MFISVDSFSLYHITYRCSCAIHTITLVEVLDTDIVLGLYATQTWIDNRKGYGDGKFSSMLYDYQKDTFVSLELVHLMSNLL